MSTPLSRRWVAKLWRRTWTLTRLSMPAALRAERQAACGGWLDRPLLVAAREQKPFGMRETPIAAQDAKQLLGQHDVTLLAALAAAFDPDDHAVTVDIGRLRTEQPPTPASLRHKRSTGAMRTFRFQNSFEKADDLVGAQHSQQLPRLASIGDPLRDRVAAERHAVEETPRADHLIEQRLRRRLSRLNAPGRRGRLPTPADPASGRNTG